MTDKHFFDLYTANEAYHCAEEDEDPEDYAGMLETYEPYISQALALNKTKPKVLWTVFDGDDGNVYICAGFHLANRIHYFVSNEEWKNDDECYLW